ncbi:MAG: threonine-phosphate decarboxylase CobD [Pseudomonadota bacterium]
MRDHGGDIDRAKARYGGVDWLDLSTGINPVPYPVGAFPDHSLSTLSTTTDITALEALAARAYGTKAAVTALNGAQAAIQLIPRLKAQGRARVVTPTYNEHSGALRDQGWTVEEVPEPQGLAGADIGIVVNPNNPDGRIWSPGELKALSENVGLLVVDESFADPHPECSLAPALAELGERVVVLRSFGKFYGLAGLRLGFALGGPETIARLRGLAGPWAVSGPAIAVGRRALDDRSWQDRTVRRLTADATRLDALALEAGWRLVGGTALFRTYDTNDAPAARDRLARAGIWTRIFPYSTRWIRIGLPGSKPAWSRLSAALTRGGE